MAITPIAGLLLLLCMLPTSKGSSWPDSVIYSDDGPIRGSIDLVSGVKTWHGVPFAAAPTGELRWKPPERPTPWTKTRQTTEHGTQCPQFDFIKGLRLGQEDCLFLSVYVPKGCSVKNPCPVMQWIYGGAWTIGSNREFGIYDASAFVKRYGVIVVAANYRLDSFGWLALNEFESESPDGSFGNYGLKDQRAAMQWTHRNIKLFGGDSNKVTLFGESAGGWSVCQHLVAPASNKLFSHAIVESGDCDGPWMLFDGKNAQRFGDAFATAAGCAANTTDRRGCLRQLSTADAMLPYISWFCLLNKKSDPFCNKSGVREALEDPHRWPNVLYQQSDSDDKEYWPTPLPPMAPIAAFAAVIDGTQSGLPDTPIRLMLAGKTNTAPSGEKISVIFGTNKDEFALFLVAIDLVIPSIMLPFKTPDMQRVADHLIAYHYHWNETTARQIVDTYDPSHYKTQSSMITHAGTEFCFRCGTRNAVRALSAHGIDSYLYVFDYHTPIYRDPASEACHLTNELECGAFHAAELPFVFGDLIVTPGGHRMSNAIGKYWSNMAKFGSPNGAAAGAVDVEWPQYNEKTDRHLVLANTVKADSQLSKKACDFWDTLPRMGPYHAP